MNDSATTPLSDAFRHAIKVADQVAQQWSTTTTWSNWHVWDYFRHNPPSSKPLTGVWNAIYPYVTCVGFSFGVASDLSAAYRETPGLEHFVDETQVLVSWEGEEGKLKPRHAVVGILTDEGCICVDLIFSPVAFIVPKNESIDTQHYDTISGRRGKRRFHHMNTLEGPRLLFENPKKEDSKRFEFHPIDHEEALKRITYYGTTRTIGETNFPENKIILVQGIVHEEPTIVPKTQLHTGTWMITTCRFQVDFKNRTLTLQLPLEDWLLKERNSQFHWIMKHEVFRRLRVPKSTQIAAEVANANTSQIVEGFANTDTTQIIEGLVNTDTTQLVDGVANLVVEMSLNREDAKTKEHLGILRTVGSSLGLEAAVLDKVVDSVYEVCKGLGK